MPNRVIKESIRTSKSVNSLSDFQFRVWLYLITYVDDYGRGSADAELLKGFLLPRRKGVTEGQIQKALDDLANTGMIRLYEVDGEPFLCFPNWDMHQRIQTKKSKHPAPPDGIQQKSTVNHGEPPPESNPNPNTNPNPNPNPNPNIEGAGKPHLSARGEYGWVKLSDEQMNRLISDFGETEANACIRYVDESAQQTGNKNKWKDWNLTVRKCQREGWHKRNTGPGRSQNNMAGANFQPTPERIRKNSEKLEKFLRETEGENWEYEAEKRRKEA